jgi:hypothetical protein
MSLAWSLEPLLTKILAPSRNYQMRGSIQCRLLLPGLD